MKHLFAAKVLFTCAMLLSLAPDASACACCSDPGQRLDQISRLTPYERDELEKIHFAPAANLFEDPGFPETVKGITSPSNAGYKITETEINGRLVFDLADQTGQPGRISFALPRRFRRFEVDPRDDTAPINNGPALYKEWRFTNLAKLGGTMAANGSNAFATLILHGHGNSCTSSIDFTHWTLEIRGKNIRFTFLGKLEAS